MYNDQRKFIDDQHLKLIKHIIHYAPSEILPVLELSIVVMFKNINRFGSIAEGFVTRPADCIVVACFSTKTVV